MIRVNVGNPIINVPFGDGLYWFTQPIKMVNLGIVHHAILVLIVQVERGHPKRLFLGIFIGTGWFQKVWPELSPQSGNKSCCTCCRNLKWTTLGARSSSGANFESFVYYQTCAETPWAI